MTRGPGGSSVPSVCLTDRLPSGRDLSDALGVNLETVQRAYRRLADEEVVTTRVGRGTGVRESVDVKRLGVETLVDDLVARAVQLGVSLDQLTSLVAFRYGANDEDEG